MSQQLDLFSRWEARAMEGSVDVAHRRDLWDRAEPRPSRQRAHIRLCQLPAPGCSCRCSWWWRPSHRSKQPVPGTTRARTVPRADWEATPTVHEPPRCPARLSAPASANRQQHSSSGARSVRGACIYIHDCVPRWLKSMRETYESTTAAKVDHDVFAVCACRCEILFSG